MRLLLDYRKNAAECRKIARVISIRDDRDRLLKMAEEWDQLAAEREAGLSRQRKAQDDMIDCPGPPDLTVQVSAGPRSHAAPGHPDGT